MMGAVKLLWALHDGDFAAACALFAEHVPATYSPARRLELLNSLETQALFFLTEISGR